MVGSLMKITEITTNESSYYPVVFNKVFFIYDRGKMSGLKGYVYKWDTLIGLEKGITGANRFKNDNDLWL